ncbi:MAG: type I methionyl aminopeptidase [Candidatus Omnitrophota bacterium]|nr:type I methionyl aminopeptidase [Candidatus Omnitrophota bacterium]
MIPIKSAREIELIKNASGILFKVARKLTEYVKPGTRTEDIDQIAGELIIENSAKPAFFGYRGFPGNICVSLNDELVHGIPGPRRLKDGDIISIDIGVELEGYFSDGAVTLPVGRISEEAKKLLEATRNALKIGIEQARPGNRLSNLSCAIQKFIEASGFSIVRDFVGHGIGSELHEEPAIPNFGQPNQGPMLEPGMVLAIEPMATQGGWKIKVLGDHWTAVTCDGLLSAHFEDTVAVTKNGPEALIGMSTL